MMQQSSLKAIFVFFILCCHLEAIPIKVPTELYIDWANTRNLPGMEPFIGHLSFRNMCDHILDQSTEWFDPDLVKQGDLIYLNLWYQHWFTQEVHDRIKVPYILVSGDVGAWFPMREQIKLLYDPKLAAWFCRNMIFSYHPKLFQLPMGQDLQLFEKSAEMVKNILDMWKNKANIDKNHLLYMNFYPRSHGDRDKIVQFFENKPFCFYEKNCVLPKDEYYQNLASSKFVLSPLGLETDCVRTWEAFAMDSIPIVEHTFNDPIYEGMPILIIDDWTKINSALLERKYEELKNLSKEKAYFPYWRKLIEATREKVRNNDLSFTKLEATRFSPDDLETIQVLLSRAEETFASLDSPLLYKGFLSTLRPFQLSQLGDFSIKICDPWMDEEILTTLSIKMYLDNMVSRFGDFAIKFFDLHRDSEILSNFSKMYLQDKISLINSEEEFSNLADSDTPLPIFLDLTYYRTSLSLNFNSSVIHKGNFRHSFKSDLEDLYYILPKGSLIIGNMGNDLYIKECLASFEKEQKIKIEKTGSFWSIERKPNSASFEDLFPDPYPRNEKPLIPFKMTEWDSYSSILVRFIQEYKIKTALLIGASSGNDSLLLAEWIPKDGKVIVLDSWEDEIELQQFMSNVVHTKMTDQITVLKKDPVEAAATFRQLKSPIDLIYLDFHENKLRMPPILKAWRNYAKKRGLLICGKGWNDPDNQKQIIQISQENGQVIQTEDDFWILNP